VKAARSICAKLFTNHFQHAQQSKLKVMLANQFYCSIKVFNFTEMNIESAVVEGSTRNYIVSGSEESVCLDK